MEADALLAVVANVGLQLTKLVERAERDYEDSPEDEREIRRAFVVAYIVARDTWAQFLVALTTELFSDEGDIDQA